MVQLSPKSFPDLSPEPGLGFSAWVVGAKESNVVVFPIFLVVYSGYIGLYRDKEGLGLRD